MKRPALHPVSEETRNLSFLLGEEILRWTHVSARPMFGMRGFYREDVIFAMLPDKRALEDPNAFAYKLPGANAISEGEKWKLFPLTNSSELSAALAVLGKAYRKAVRTAPK